MLGDVGVTVCYQSLGTLHFYKRKIGAVVSYKSFQAICGADDPSRARPPPAQSCLWGGRSSSDLKASNLNLILASMPSLSTGLGPAASAGLQCAHQLFLHPEAPPGTSHCGLELLLRVSEISKRLKQQEQK